MVDSKVLGLLLLCSVTLAFGASDVGQRDGSPVIDKKQDGMDLAGLDMSALGDDMAENLDFICNTFCPKPDDCDEPAVKNEDLLEEIEKLKELVITQTAAIEALKTEVESKQTGSEVIPKEYRPAYPVFSVVSQYGHYQFTLAEARQACSDRGAKLATYKQMLAAWEKGMDLCSCGWIDEGYAMYPIWYSRDGCSNRIGPGIRYNCTWQSTWNAWCFSDDIANKVEA